MQNDETTLEANGVDDDSNEDGETESETDLYKETKIKRDAKLAAKAQKYSRYIYIEIIFFVIYYKFVKAYCDFFIFYFFWFCRTAPVVAMPETLVDGKRHINYAVIIFIIIIFMTFMII